MSSNKILIADENPSSRILIIENNPGDLKLLKDYLINPNYEIETAINGRDIHDKVNTFHPDLILLNVDIQDFDSFEFCKKIKTAPVTKRIMILMNTALNELDNIERAVAAGCDDFLSKPINKAELLKRVENLIKLGKL